MRKITQKKREEKSGGAKHRKGKKKKWSQKKVDGVGGRESTQRIIMMIAYHPPLLDTYTLFPLSPFCSSLHIAIIILIIIIRS